MRYISTHQSVTKSFEAVLDDTCDHVCDLASIWMSFFSRQGSTGRLPSSEEHSQLHPTVARETYKGPFQAQSEKETFYTIVAYFHRIVASVHIWPSQAFQVAPSRI